MTTTTTNVVSSNVTSGGGSVGQLSPTSVRSNATGPFGAYGNSETVGPMASQINSSMLSAHQSAFQSTQQSSTQQSSTQQSSLASTGAVEVPLGMPISAMAAAANDLASSETSRHHAGSVHQAGSVQLTEQRAPSSHMSSQEHMRTEQSQVERTELVQRTEQVRTEQVQGTEMQGQMSMPGITRPGPGGPGSGGSSGPGSGGPGSGYDEYSESSSQQHMIVNVSQMNSPVASGAMCRLPLQDQRAIWLTMTEKALEYEQEFVRRSCAERVRTMLGAVGVPVEGLGELDMAEVGAKVVRSNPALCKRIILGIKWEIFRSIQATSEALGFELDMPPAAAAPLVSSEEMAAAAPGSRLIAEAAVRIAIHGCAGCLAGVGSVREASPQLQDLMRVPVDAPERQKPQWLLSLVQTRRREMLSQALNAAIESYHWEVLKGREMLAFVESCFRKNKRPAEPAGEVIREITNDASHQMVTQQQMVGQRMVAHQSSLVGQQVVEQHTVGRQISGRQMVGQQMIARQISGPQMVGQQMIARKISGPQMVGQQVVGQVGATQHARVTSMQVSATRATSTATSPTNMQTQYAGLPPAPVMVTAEVTRRVSEHFQRVSSPAGSIGSPARSVQPATIQYATMQPVATSATVQATRMVMQPFVGASPFGLSLTRTASSPVDSGSQQQRPGVVRTTTMPPTIPPTRVTSTFQQIQQVSSAQAGSQSPQTTAAYVPDPAMPKAGDIGPTSSSTARMQLEQKAHAQFNQMLRQNHEQRESSPSNVVMTRTMLGAYPSGLAATGLPTTGLPATGVSTIGVSATGGATMPGLTTTGLTTTGLTTTGLTTASLSTAGLEEMNIPSLLRASPSATNNVIGRLPISPASQATIPNVMTSPSPAVFVQRDLKGSKNPGGSPLAALEATHSKSYITALYKATQ
ncbi:hypothetical protein GNI_106100 [Gregarina niphandrodes]|uniref:Uncharacterized protein n=1 Tax=Gregarina niphandrodes TaxID=110365 RepID=A0A023B3Y5_GRENI|nr:hypothetical protein GNI_106100 [Gregarina niphandrodes]EZG56046.1 hypothetical protein GNI_106100 [Gregarina niphandrodes]|eukprot:XP_011131365.1 hypothetical protein GNI_106100 [Gregarina niphandrodes]